MFVGKTSVGMRTVFKHGKNSFVNEAFELYVQAETWSALFAA